MAGAVGRELRGGVTLGSMVDIEEWTARVSAWRRSGLTAEQFCRGRGYSSRLGPPTADEAEATPRTAMVDVGAVRPRERIVLEVDGVRVQVPDEVDASTLRTVLAVLLESGEDGR